MTEQNQILPQAHNYKIRVLFWSRVSLWLLSFLNSLLNFFSLRTSEHYWGVVYDSTSKQPLDPVIVKLLYADSREVETCVTDLSGRYGFLARPGKFKIFARKSNYSFPSRLAPGDTDGIYENLYHGEFFVLGGDNEVVAPNIPMDPDRVDWNQTAKLKVANAHPFWKLFFKKLLAVLFWFFLPFCGLGLWRFYPREPAWLYTLTGAWFLLLILGLAIPEPRLWGRVKFNTPIAGDESMLLELRGLKFRDVISGRAKVLDNGKFLLRSNPGKYLLSIVLVNSSGERQEIGQVKVKVEGSGVLNAAIKITQTAV
jgi:hypothetical protein